MLNWADRQAAIREAEMNIRTNQAGIELGRSIADRLQNPSPPMHPDSAGRNGNLLVGLLLLAVAGLGSWYAYRQGSWIVEAKVLGATLALALALYCLGVAAMAAFAGRRVGGLFSRIVGFLIMFGAWASGSAWIALAQFGPGTSPWISWSVRCHRHLDRRLDRQPNRRWVRPCRQRRPSRIESFGVRVGTA